VLLAEANQWPDDVVEYFGDGDECHMAFHFPVMPRMFMAHAPEDATPISRSSTDAADSRQRQWGLFLRNHDELTLEMVTDEERDYMYAEYAKDPRMKLNLGSAAAAPAARQRPRRHRALTAILFSLPGARSSTTATRSRWATTSISATATACRTPMQWTGDRNGGFSRADFAQLYLPPSWTRLRLPGGERRGAAADARRRSCAGCTASSRCARSTRCSARHLRGAAPATTRSSPTSGRYEDDIVLCVHNVARVGAGGRARPVAVPGHGAGGDVRTHPLPAQARAYCCGCPPAAGSTGSV
jgi:maltose alpha-D-glucosyltransferase/alpha-amylase